MAAGWPTKANYATGDVLSATNMNDLSGTVNYIDPTSATDGQVLTRDAASAGKVKWATAGSSGSTNVAGKNGVLNSNFSIWQRGTSVAQTGSATYTADRWCALRAGGTTGSTISRQVTNDTTNLPFIQYAARVQRDLANTGTSKIFFANNFETVNTIPFVGKTVTFSFYARKGANYSSASDALEAKVIYGTGTDQNNLVAYTGEADAISQTATLTTTWQRFSYSATLSTTATELAVRFAYTPVGTALANDYFEVTGVQLEIAASASAYSPNASTQALELAACQRYYWRQGGESAYQYFANGIGQSSGTNARFLVTNPVVMRVKPTSIDYSTLQINDANTGTTVTAVAFDQAGSRLSSIDANVSSGAVGQRPYFLMANASASAYLGFNAEL